jgi:hypothetical protein
MCVISPFDHHISDDASKRKTNIILYHLLYEFRERNLEKNMLEIFKGNKKILNLLV